MTSFGRIVRRGGGGLGLALANGNQEGVFIIPREGT